VDLKDGHRLEALGGAVGSQCPARVPVQRGIMPAAGTSSVGGFLSPFPCVEPMQPEGTGWDSQWEPGMVSLAHGIAPALLAAGDGRCSATPCLQSYTADHQAASFYPISC